MIQQKPWTPAKCHILGAEERRLKRMGDTLQGGATEGNNIDGALMVDQGKGGVREWRA